MAILCVAAFHQVDDYPEAILPDQAKKIVLGHRKDFFGNNRFDNNSVDNDSVDNQNKLVKGVRMTNIDDFIQRVDAVKKVGARAILPTPFSFFNNSIF